MNYQRQQRSSGRDPDCPLPRILGAELRARSCSRVCIAAAHTLITRTNLIACGQRFEVLSFGFSVSAWSSFHISIHGFDLIFDIFFENNILFSNVSCFLPYQVFEESRDLPGEHGQVQEAGGDLVVVLRQVTVPQVLQELYVLLLVVHVG